MMADVNKGGRPKSRGEIYRFNLYLDADLADFVKDKAHEEKTSITGYFNSIIRQAFEEDKRNKEIAHLITKRKHERTLRRLQESIDDYDEVMRMLKGGGCNG